jgi:hypothetical protein
MYIYIYIFIYLQAIFDEIKKNNIINEGTDEIHDNNNNNNSNDKLYQNDKKNKKIRMFKKFETIIYNYGKNDNSLYR